ncbi:hypothetical protein D3C80_1732650 [compost metagenome]
MEKLLRDERVAVDNERVERVDKTQAAKSPLEAVENEQQALQRAAQPRNKERPGGADGGK